MKLAHVTAAATTALLISFLLLFPLKLSALSGYNNTNISIKTTDVIPAGYSLELIIDHKTMVERGLSRVDGNDLKIFYSGDGTFADEVEIDRVLDPQSHWNVANTKIWFRTKETISGNSDDNSHYRLYFGLTEPAGVLDNKAMVFDAYEDFTDGFNNWNVISGIWRTDNGELKSAGDNAYVLYSLDNIDNFYAQITLKNIYQDQYFGILGRADAAGNFYLFNHDANAGDLRIYKKKDGSWNLLSAVSGNEAANNGTLSIKFVGGILKGFLNSSEILNASDGDLTSGRIGLFAQGVSETAMDDFIIRKAVENEPAVALTDDNLTSTPILTPSVSPTPTPFPSEIPTATPTPTLTPSPVLTVSPTPTLTPTPLNSPTPTATPMPTLTPTPTQTPDNEYPLMNTAKSEDSDGNGRIDRIILEFNKDLNGTTVTGSDFTVSGYMLGSKKPKEDKGIVTLFLVEGVYFDTGQRPEVYLRENGVKDLGGNWNKFQTIETNDKAGPFIFPEIPESNSENKQNYIEIKGTASDYSSSEDSLVTKIDLYIRGENKEEWQMITTLVNDEFVEPFEYKHEWTPQSNGIFDLKIAATDLSDNTAEKVTVKIAFTKINDRPDIPDNTSPTPTPTPILTPSPILTSTPTPTPTSTPTPTPSPSPVPSENGGDDDSGKDDKVNSDSNNSCSDEKPHGSLIIKSVTSGFDTVRIEWEKMQGPLTNFALVYGDSPGLYKYGNPYIGDGNATSVEVESLKQDKTYYFALLPVNGCTPGDLSDEIEVRTATENSETKTANGRVLGAVDVNNKLPQITLPVISKPVHVKPNDNLLSVIKMYINEIFSLLFRRIKSFLD